MSSKYWDEAYSRLDNIEFREVEWLEQYNSIFSESTSKPILDIGCGTGSDSIHLLNKGYTVISCDFSKTVLEKLVNHDSRVNTKRFDIEKGLPFKDSDVHVILASLSLHYFSWESTRQILKEIERVLDINGYLICRLNSTNDVNYGAGSGKEIEKNLYKISRNYYKRFFDEESIDKLFCNWKIIIKKECFIGRFGNSKKAWEIVVRKP